MNYIDEILKRADLQHIREFMNKISDIASLGNEELNQAVEDIVKNYL